MLNETPDYSNKYKLKHSDSPYFLIQISLYF